MESLTDLGVEVAGEVATSLLSKLKKHVAYLYKYKHNLNALVEAKHQLDAKRSDASRFSAQTGLSVKDVGNTVQLWQSDAETLDQNAEKLISRNNISRLNLWSRYSTSKHAWELTQMINEKVKTAPDFGTSFDRSIEEGAKFNLRGYMEFESRQKTMNEVLDALKRDDVSMCSICGMGGIGKTTLAKKLVKKVEADRLFDKVVLVTVSQNPNFEEIQKEIIDSLELKIESNTMKGRAKKLNDWLSNRRTLLILDDVWWQIQDDDFEKVGVPVASNRCKIVFTSRNIDECKKMGSEPNFPLKDLDAGEALELFLQNAGKCVEERNLRDKARQIVNECHGLPIAIVTIAKALKDSPQGEWDDSLTKLQKSNLPGISDMEKVYSKIQVSYDLLKDSEAQSCLQFCCLFPEDYNVPVEKLVFYGKSLELFNGVASLKEARDRVDSIVHKLKSSFMLLDSEKEECVKLHDIVRDFAIWISSKDENPYLVMCEKEMEMWPEICLYEKCSAISFVCKKIKNHPVCLRCPSLKLLHLDFCQDMLPKGFFDGMEYLRVVDLAISMLPTGTMPKALRTLLVTNNSLGDCSNHLREMLREGNLKNLEIFSLPWMKLSEFPMEIRFMRNLRCLRFHGGIVENIPPGVLSNLVQLEELELPPIFQDWGLQKEGRSNASLDEIRSLPLNSITIGLRKGMILAENIVKRVTRFRIDIEGFGADYDFYSNLLVVRHVDACDTLVEWTSSLLRKCHSLELHSVDLKYIMSQQLGGNDYYQCAHFSQLKTLGIHIMNSLEEILHGTYLSNRQQPCFTNLTRIEIEKCPKLNHAFPLSVAREFTQLESMNVMDCREMEAVFYDDDQEDGGNQVESRVKLNAPSNGKQVKHIPRDQNMEERIEKIGEREVDHAVVLPRLKLLRLLFLPELRAVYNGNHAIECPSLEIFQNVRYLDAGLERFCYEPGKLIELDNMKGHLKNISEWLHFAQENGIQQRKRSKITRCHGMKYLADAIECPNLLEAFFSHLEELWIDCMDSLEEIWHGPYLPKIHAQCFSNLTKMWIYKCPKMKRLFPLPVATELKQLQEMTIDMCNEIEEIFYKDQVDDGNQLASSVHSNDPTIETATPTPNKDEKSLVLCPTPTSLIQWLLPKGKQSKHLLSHEIIEENVGKGDEREADHVIVWPQLKRLSLSSMPNLRVMYNGDLTIECPSFEEVSIDKCNIMEGLSYGSFSAPKTKKLYLRGLRHLKNFLKHLHLEQNSTTPQLEKLWIYSCPETICLVDAMTDWNLQRTLFSSSEKWRISDMNGLEEIWRGPYSPILQPQPCLSRLTHVFLSDCPKLKRMFPLSVATELTQLQVFIIDKCQKMEEIFYKDQVAYGNQSIEENIQKVDPAIVFPRLRVLSFSSMPELRVMYDGNNAIECPSLEKLSIDECNKMEGLSYGSFSAPKTKTLELCGVRHMKCIPKWLHLEQGSGFISFVITLSISRCHEMIFLVDATDRNLSKTLFCNLEHLQIGKMGGLQEIWHGPYLSIAQPQPYFTHLTRIDILNCSKLKRVFPLSVATELTQLQKLGIKGCQEMEEIFYQGQAGNGNEVTEEYTGKGDEREMDHAIVWPRLKYLDLDEMPKLRFVYNWKRSIECPSLEELSIFGCNNMEGLSYGSFSAPKTKKLCLHGLRHLKNFLKCLHLEQDSGTLQLKELSISSCHETIYLVDAMKDRNLVKSFFPRSAKLRIMRMDSLEEILHGPYLSQPQLQPCFSHLTLITILDCQKLKHVLPLSVATELTQLRRLEIKRCAELEEIFYKDRMGSGIHEIASSVELNIPATETASRPPCSTHQETTEENKTKGDEKEVDDATVDATIFPELRFLILEDLTELRVFYDGNHSIELPSLHTMKINGCNKIKTLSNGSFKAPELTGILINRKWYPSGEDINTIVKKTLNIDELEDEDKEEEVTKDAN